MVRLIKSTFYHEQETKDALCAFIQDADILSIREQCKQFEEDFATWQERKYCVAVNSGSSANLVLIQAMLNLGRLKKGDKVGFSALTRATNVMPLIQLGLTPIPIDVEMETLNISSTTVTTTLEQHDLKGIFITNLLGWCDDIDAIQILCQEKEIVLLEDNCESMGSVYKGKKLGNYSLGSTFSTYVGHHMSTIEGGMVCADDEELYDMLMMTRAHGRDRNMSAQQQEKIRKKYEVQGFYDRYTFYTLGYNVRPTEIQGFIGCQQVPYLDEIMTLREKNFKVFVDKINSNDDFYTLKYEHMDLLSNFAMPVICKSQEILEKYKTKFEKAQVEIRPIVGGDMTQQIFWKEIYGENTQETHAKLIHQNGFYFGNSPEYADEEIVLLCKLLDK